MIPSDPTEGIIGSNRLRILGLIMANRISVRELQRASGIRSPNGIKWHLRCLRRDGWITWEKGKARTLNATCPFIPTEELFQDQEFPESAQLYGTSRFNFIWHTISRLTDFA